jgi:hypothetical protein
MIKSGKYLLLIMGFFLFSSYTVKEKNNSLIGKWQYLDCTIKNTGVNGTIQFFKDSTFRFKGEVHQDFPTKPFTCKHKYSVNGNKISCLTEEFPPFQNPPIADYFFILNDRLYFSSQPMTEVVDDWSGNYRKTNWIYCLERVKQ